MGSALFANNAFSTLASSITDSDTTISLDPGDGALFPSPTGTDYFYATLIDTSNNLEIVKCTARSTDDLTVTRAQESTTARAFASGDRIELRLTAAGLGDLRVNNPVTECIAIALGDETTDLAVATGVVAFHMPYAFTLTDVKVGMVTAPTGSVATFDLNEAGTSVLSTLITVDAGEKTSATAATPPVISDASLAADALMTVDVDGIGSTIAGAGAKIYLIGYQP